MAKHVKETGLFPMSKGMSKGQHKMPGRMMMSDKEMSKMMGKGKSAPKKAKKK